MSLFSDGFNFGFATGMFNNMFGAFNPFGFGGFGGFGSFGFNNFNIFGGFNSFNCFNFTPPSFPVMNFDSFTPPNSTFGWGFSGGGFGAPMFDTFTYSAPTGRSPNTPYRDEDTSYFSYDAQELKNKWLRKKPGLNLSDGFFNKVVNIAKQINCDPNDLMGLMNSESGLNPSAVNRSSKATGLIQFMPETAIGLGTTVEALERMSAEEQLVYVEKYLVDAKRSAHLGSNKIGAGTLYALVFLPAFAGSEVLTRKGETYYSWNPRLDTNGDDAITKSELAARIVSHRA